MNHEYQIPKTAEELRAAHAFSADGKELEIVIHDEEEPLLVCAHCDAEKGIRHGGNIKHGICPTHKTAVFKEMLES